MKIIVLTPNILYPKYRGRRFNILNIKPTLFDVDWNEYIEADLVYFRQDIRAIVLKTKVENFKEVIQNRDKEVIFIDKI